MSGANTGEDCHFFVTSECTKGEACPFRHSEAAKANTTVCSFWLAGHCGRLSCGFRHPSLPKGGAAPMGRGRGGGFPMNPFQMMPMMAPAGCKYFLQGTCRNGAACPFGHGGFIGGFPQQQFGGGFDQQQQQPHQQQQQHERKERKPKREREAKEPRQGGRQRDTPVKAAAAAALAGPAETDEQRRERLLSKPLPAVRSKKVAAPPATTGAAGNGGAGAAANVVVVSKAKRAENSPEPESEQTKKAKSGGGKAGLDAPLSGKGAAKKAEAAPVVKSLAQIIAEKDGPAATATATTTTSNSSKTSSLDAELLALGIVPAAQGSAGGAVAASKGGAKAAATARAYEDELRAMGLDMDEFGDK